MKILLIAPSHPDLPDLQNEVNAISAHHDVKRLVGEVREVDIQRAVNDGPFEIFWCATHGSPAGILLSGTTMLTAEAIGQYVGASGAGLCVLNTCASEEVASWITAGSDADLIYTISANIRDADALRFASILAGELAKTEDYEAAFQTAAGPGATKYRYVKANDALRAVALASATVIDKLRTDVELLSRSVYEAGIKSDGMREQLLDIREQNANNNNRFLALNQAFGDLRTTVQGLTNQQQYTTDDRRRLAEIQSIADIRQAGMNTQPGQQTVNHYPPVFWLMAAFMLIGLLGLIFYLGGLIK